MPAPIKPTPIADVPATPDRNEGQDIFVPKMYNFTAYFAPFRDWLQSCLDYCEAAIDWVASLVVSAESAASDASEYSGIAMAIANFKGEWSNQTGAAAIPYSVWHNGDAYALLANLANVATVEPGTSPSTWANITAAMSGYTNPLTTKGDIIVADTGGVQTRFAAPVTPGLATLLRYDVNTGLFSWADEQSYLGGGGGSATGEIDWFDKGNVATSGSETVTLNINDGRFQVVSMESANTTGALTLQLTNLPATTNKTATMLIYIRRAGRKAITISASGFTINYAQGASPQYNGTSGYFDIVQIVKKFGSTNLDVAVIGTGIH